MNQDSTPAEPEWRRRLGSAEDWRRRAQSLLTDVRIRRPARFVEFPIDVVSVLSSIVICFLLTWFLNSIGMSGIHSAYEGHVPTVLQGATTSTDAVNRLIAAGWADEKLREWLVSGVEADQTSATLILRLCKQIASQEKHPQATANTLQRLATGDPTSFFPPPSVALRTISGAELVEELRRVDPFLHSSLAKDEKSDEKLAFLVRLCDDLLSATRPGIRNVRRWNGSCQWLTIALTAFSLIMLGRRTWMLRQLLSGPDSASAAPGGASSTGSSAAANWSDSDLAAIPRLLAANRSAGASHAEQTMLLQEESNRLSAAVESRVYDPLSFLTSCLPSLGFIGTVVGMGEALLLADALFGSANRQRVISGMTEQLGYAFDTTLVALLCGLLVGAVTALVRRYDHAFLAAYEATLVGQFLQDRGKTAGGEGPRR